MPSLIELQLEVLFARDARGRLVSTRDPTPRPAPRLFLARSAEGNAWAIRCDVDPATHRELDRLCAAEPALPEPAPSRAPVCRERVCGLLAPVELEYRGPAYLLPDDLPRDDRAREITPEQGAGCADAFPWLANEFEAVAPVAVAFTDGRPAAVCHSARGCTARAAEAGVETLERFRGRGLATAAVACWARAIQQSGRLALYSTDWENTPSLAVARRLSARMYGESWHLT